MIHIFEMVLGALMALAGMALATGIADAVLPQVPIGLGLAMTLAIVGLLLIFDGILGRQSRSTQHQNTHVRTVRLASRATACLIALALVSPLLSGPLNLVAIQGFPLGYYIAAQGAIIAFALLAFAIATRQNAIDGEHVSGEE
jgi:putative solute:sodium symporter small subunit